MMYGVLRVPSMKKHNGLFKSFLDSSYCLKYLSEDLLQNLNFSFMWVFNASGLLQVDLQNPRT